MSNLTPGKFRARPVNAQLGTSDNGKDFIAISFDVDFEDGSVEGITAYQYFSTEGAAKQSIKALRNCGWTGDDLSADLAADGFGSCEVELDLAEEEYTNPTSGETSKSLKVRWINRPGGPVIANPMDDQKKKAFAAKMRGLAMANKPAASSAAKPAQRAPANGRSYGPHANEPDPNDPRFGGHGGDSDLPFLPHRLGGDGKQSRRTRCGRDGCSRRRSDTAPRRGRPGAVFERGDNIMIGALAEHQQQRTTSRARNHAPLTNARAKDEVERATAFLAAKGPTTPPPDARAVVARRIAMGRGRR